MSHVVKLFWILSLCGAGFGAVTILDLSRAESAPQQAAIAAMAAAFAIVPYVWARALGELVHKQQIADDLAVIKAALANQGPPEPKS